MAALGGAAQAQTFEETLATTYRTNPTLLAARAELRGINEGVAQALSGWRPNVVVSGSGGVQRVDSNVADPEQTEPRDVRLIVEQFLYRGGRTLAATARAEAEVDGQRALLRATEQTVLFAAATAFSDVWRDQKVLELTRNNERVLERQREATNDRFEVGEVTRTDVAQSESRLAGATADRIDAEGSLTASRARFQETVGIAPGVLERPEPAMQLPASLEEAVAMAQESNPGVVAARHFEVAAQKTVRFEFGDLLPEVRLEGELSRQQEFSSNDSESDRARILGVVRIPLYQQGFESSQVREAKQIANQRRLEIEEARRAAEQEATSAWEDLETARGEIASFEEEVRATGVALEGIKQENAVGARTILDILDGEQEFLEAQVSLAQAQRDEVVAAYAVLRAIGTLTAERIALQVDLYDPDVDYRAVRGKIYGTGIPNE